MKRQVGLMNIVARCRILLLAWVLCGLASAEEYQAFAPVLGVEPVFETRHEPVSRQVCTEPDASAREFDEIAPTIGGDIRRQARLWQQQRRCRTVTQQRAREHITGYRVRYRYGGETETALLPYDPGEQMRVKVSLSPVR
jgi:uncharacterized protein YcfJ